MDPSSAVCRVFAIQEIVDNICSKFCRKSLKSLLLTSRTFQYAVESQANIFSTWTFKTETDWKFKQVYSGRRFRLLRELRFYPRFPWLREDSDAGDPRHYTIEELRDLDKAFTSSIELLFQTIYDIEASAGNEGYGNISLAISTPVRSLHRRWCYHRYFTSYRLHLLAPETLPRLSSIRCFSVSTHGYDISKPRSQGFSQYGLERTRFPRYSYFKIDLRVLVDLLTKMPNCSSADFSLGGEEWIDNYANSTAARVTFDFPGPRRDSLHDFGKALEAAELPSIRHLKLDFLVQFQPEDKLDQLKALPNLVAPLLHDPVSSSLRILSYQLRVMHLRLVADETLFWPADGSCPSWPNMETLNVKFHPSTPSGSWYFEGREGVGMTDGHELTDNSYPPYQSIDGDSEDHDEMKILDFWRDARTPCNQFRVDPRHATLTPFLTAFAKAAGCMPSLKTFALWSTLSLRTAGMEGYGGFDETEITKFPGNELEWGIAYAAPGAQKLENQKPREPATTRQLWWRTGRWRPALELHGLFQNIGSGRRADLVEYWNNEESGNGLCQADNFQYWGQDWPCVYWLR